MIDDKLAANGLEAVDRFMEAFNSRSPEAFAATLNYPHVRPSHFGVSRVFDDAESYAAVTNYQRADEMGWHHTEWDYTHAVHTSEEKVHVAGQYTRYTAGGEEIISVPVVYIATHVDGAWGIQSRFGSDYVSEEDVTSMQQRSFKLIDSFVLGHNHGNLEHCSELLNYPHVSIDPGEVDATNVADEFTLLPYTDLRLESIVSLQTGRLTTNLALELIASDEEKRSRKLECVALVTEREGHLGIQAWSLIEADPD